MQSTTRILRATASLLLAFWAGACAHAAFAEAAAAPESAGGATGIASWYGADFQGRRTSNGEVYDKEKLSCAHRSLPFGSYILVRNLDNGSSVVVRVNDRGPFAKNRIIDLSEAAARVIGMIPTGTARVSLEPMPEEEALAWKGGSLDGASASGQGPVPAMKGGAATGQAAAAGQTVSPNARIRIQVASYSSEANAKGTIARLAASGLSAEIERAGLRYRVVFPDLSPQDSRLVCTRLDGLGYRGYTVTTILPSR
jgi:rare lipoprotein A